MSDGQPSSGFQRWTPLFVGGAICCIIIGVLFLAPDSIRVWIAGTLTAILAGYLANVLPGWIQRSRALQTHPIVATAQILDVDYISIPEPNGATASVPASGHIIRISLEAADSRTALLQAMRPIVLSRQAVTGQLAPHLGVVQPRPFEVLLDEDPPRIMPIQTPGSSAAPNFPFKVAPDDPEVFDLTVRTSNGVVFWILELDWTCSGRRGTLKIDLGGKPFRTAARPKTAVSTASGR
jgi:hypothetical protein